MEGGDEIMSKQVDDRVVSMEFDNRKFEQNVQTSMSTLEKLKRSLKFGDAAKGFDNIETASGNVQMAPLTKAVETVSNKFSALEVIAITALANITNKAVNAGLQMVKSLSLDQVIAGWEKYNQKTASVQTLMNATGEDLETVNGYLDKLMWFSDETSYGFTDMTSALATMTSSGGDVESLIPLIEGVANATAYAGKGATEFQRAMYNINQSYSQGYLSLMDWKSLEQAGVSSEALKQTIIDTAVELGKISEGQVEVGTFASTLNEKWADKEVMESAFGKFASMTEEAYRLIEEGVYENATEAYADLADQFDDMYAKAAKSAQEFKTFSDAVDATKDAVSTGWMVTFDTIFGNYEEQKSLWTDVGNLMYDVFAASAEARNELLADWKDLGGRDDLIEGFWNIIDAIKAIVKPIKDAFRDIFPKKTAEQLADATKRFKEFTEKLIISEKTGEKLRSTFKGVFAVLDVGITIIKEVVKGAAKIIGSLSDMVKGLFGVTGSFGDFLSNIRDSIKESGFFTKAIETIVSILQSLIGAITNVAKFIKEKFAAPGWEFFYKLLKGIYDILLWLGSKIGNIIGSIVSSFNEALQNGNISNLLDVFNSGVIGAILVKIYKSFNTFGSSLKSVVGSFENITGVLSGVGGILQAWQQNLQAKTIKTIAIAIAILAGALLVLSFIDSNKITDSLTAITVLFAELMGAMAIFSKFAGTKMAGVIGLSGAMVAMSIAILIMASALKTISGISVEDMITAIIGITAITTMVAILAKVLSKNEKAIAKGTGKLIAIAIAIDLLALAVKIIGGMDPVSLAKGIGGVVLLLYSMIGAMAILSKFKATGAANLIAMAVALNLLAIPIKLIGSMKLEGIAKGVGALVVVLYALVGAAALMSALGAYGLVGAAGLLLLSASIGVMAVSLALLVPVMAAMNLIDMNKVCLNLLKLSGVLVVLGIASVVSPLLILLGVGLKALGAGLLTMIPGLTALMLLDFAGIYTSLLKFAGVLVLLGIAAVVTPLLILLGAALVFVGAGALLTGAGFSALAVGMTAFAAAWAVSSVIIINGLISLVTAIIGLIPAIVEAVGNGIILILKTIAGSVDAISDAISAIIIALCNAIIKSLPKLMEAVGALLDAVIDLLIKYVPKLVEAAAKIVVGILEGLTKFVPQMLQAAVKLMDSFLQGIASMIPKIIESAFNAIFKLIDGMINAIGTYIPLLQAKLFELAQVIAMTLGQAIGEQMANILQVGLWIVQGLWNGIKSGLANLKSNIMSFGTEVLNTIKSALKEHSPSEATKEMGVNLDKGMIAGIDNYANAVYKAGENVGAEAIDGMSTALVSISDVLDDEAATEPVIRPVMDLSDVEEGAGKINDILSENAIDGAVSKSASINSSMSGTQNGGYGDILKAINNLGAKISELSQPSYRIGDIIYDDGSEIATAIKSLVRAARRERRA